MTSSTPCKTIGQAISLASAGDSIRIAPATYKENLTLSFDLSLIGSDASTTIIDGRFLHPVITITSLGGGAARVILSNLTIQRGWWAIGGGGILNGGDLTINNSVITENGARCYAAYCSVTGGGILNSGGMLVINDSIISGNGAGSTGPAYGGGIYNAGSMTINNSTLSGNAASSSKGIAFGGGIYNFGDAVITNSTIASNSVYVVRDYPADAGAIANVGTLKISNSTISLNTAKNGVGGIGGQGGSATLKNSIVADNQGGNCTQNVASLGYNLSSDNSCPFNQVGDQVNTEPMLGPLQDNGGPTQTMAVPPGSPAIDAGNPSGCTDGFGHLLTTDQRGMPRPDPRDSGGCDIGAYENQAD